jgi:putative colanic acid biosynthesis acetyltransferase WcaF
MTRIDLSRSKSHFPLREKILRLVWSVLVWPLFRHLPRSFSQWRVAALRGFGAKIGNGVFLERGITVWLPWRLEIADSVAIGRNVEIYNYGRVRIGTMTVVSQYCYLCTGTHDFEHPAMPLTWDDISIGSECWVAAGSWLLPGVQIGNGTVVGARSLVTRSLPEWMVCAGHPCVPLKPRVVRPES